MGEHVDDGSGRHERHGAPGGPGYAQLEAEGEVAVARLALDSGELSHAASHIGRAMDADPRLPEAHESLSELAARAGGPEQALELFPESERYAGSLACRAHLLAACGRFDDALMVLAAVMGAVPTKPWADTAWLARPGLAAQMDPHAVARAVVNATSHLGETADQQTRYALQPFYNLVCDVIAANPDNGRLLAIASLFARRMDDVDEAIAWARAACDHGEPSMGAIMLGGALRHAGRDDEALTVWTAELERDPAQTHLAMDIAELHASLGRPAEGLRIIEGVLADEPDHPTAAPAVLGIRYEMDGDPAHLVSLADHLRAHPDRDYAEYLLTKHSHKMAWLRRVPSATEATINVLRQFLDSPDGKGGNDHPIQLAASMIEPPSSALAFRLAFPNMRLTVQSYGEPDPRHPVQPVDIAVWAFDDFDAVPAVAPPSPESAELVRSLATVTWRHLPWLYDRAVALAATPLDDLLGVLVHPPRPADDETGRALAAHGPDFWVRAVQTIACVGIAHHRTDQPWPNSDRRRVLLDLLNGPEDWVSEAAGAALVTAAWVEPDVRPDVAKALATRLVYAAQALRQRPVTIARSLAQLVLACPWAEPGALGLANTLIEVANRQDEVEPEDAEERGREMLELAKSEASHSPAPSSPDRKTSPPRRLFGRKKP